MTAAAGRLLAVTDAFAERTIVVIGDLITDEYLIGKPGRISREAPVIILKFSERDVRLGGAANAAHNVAALGARVVPVGVIGRDRAGEELLAGFLRVGITTDGIVVEAGRTTPMKTRIMAGGYQATRQQVVRLDREPSAELMPASEDALLEGLSAVAARADAIVVSDYGYGTVTPRVFDHVQAIARRRGAIVAVDSRYELTRFIGVTAATPNAGMLLVTRGSQGLAVLEREGGATFIPIFGTDEIADVTGAGDTVISAFTLALASGGTPVQAAMLANVAGGLVVMKRGTATVPRAELRQALGSAS